MKSKILNLISLSILSLVLMLNFASAALTLDEISVVPNVTNHNTEVTVTFNLSSDTTAYSTLIWSSSNAGSKATWTTLPTITSIDGTSNEVQTLTAVLKINEHASGTITDAKLNVNDTTTGDTDTLDISTITINPSKALSVESKTISESTNSTTIKVTNEGNTLLSNIQLTVSGDFTVSLSGTTLTSSHIIPSLSAGAEETITVTRTSNLEDVGQQSVTITATADDNTSASGKVTTEASLCGYTKNLENLDITIKDINVKQGFGDDEDYWYPFDVIEVEIEVENKGNYDMEDIEVSWELHTDDGKKISDDEESDFKLDSDDEETITLTIKLDDDVDEFEGVDELTLYARAKGKIDDKDSSHDGESTCEEDKETVDLITDDNFMVLDDFEINGMKLKDLELSDAVDCGAELQIVAELWNIGDDDQDDVTVLIRNSELGITEKIEMSDVDSFDYEKLETTIKIPQDIESKYYILEFMIYDEDNDIFETDEDDDALFKVLIKVEGDCKVSKTTAVTASLESEAKAGEKLTVKTTITNTGDKTSTYLLNIADYSSWATFNELDSNSLTLVAGESREVTLDFDIKKDASGDNQFNIEVVEGTTVTKQPVSVSVKPQKSLFSGIKLPENNLYLWAIGALNIILILAIIAVAIRLSKD